ncbi:ABC transporter permease [Amycolatopsis kentuckyensis]|uniref:ABC transporter permease n=1 Tax=Amycolatopsis kentuckyensis TaxID=218823 RepID=UPI001FC90D0B|nr:ABC transporter permease [Amycolatopsis kentuckyensis]
MTGRTLRIVGSRVASAALVLWGAVTLAFAALHLMPGDPVDAVVGGANQVTPELRAEIVRAYALDRPLAVQYLDYLGRLLRGDLGESFALRMPVVDAIGQQLLPTLTLLVAATALALAVATVAALLTAHRPGWIRGLCSAAEVVGVGVPAFWLAILLLTLFSFQLGWFPAIGDTGFAGSVLPVVALTVAPAGVLTRLLRRELERTLDEPFVVTARARGLTEAAVRVRHVLRHALIPVITLAGWLAGTMISGAVVVEKVFSRPGLGRLTVEAVDHKDVPLVLGVVLVAAAFYVAVNLATDVVYRLVDPRLRDEEPVR